MTKYENIYNDSGIIGYDEGENFIRVYFHDDSIYLYTNESCGYSNIETMKLLASTGEGLNAYINTNVRKNYERKKEDKISFI